MARPKKPVEETWRHHFAPGQFEKNKIFIDALRNWLDLEPLRDAVEETAEIRRAG